MLVECYDKKGAEVYEMIIKQIFQDLILGPSVEDLKAFADPDQVVFILVIKMKKASDNVYLRDVANLVFNKDENQTVINVDDEKYLPNILKRLWETFSREETLQPNRFNIIVSGEHYELNDLIVDNSNINLQKKIYDAVFRILPEGFKIIKDISRGDIIAVIATDELIKDAWIEKAEEYIEELT
ncbi:methanogenesis marker 17 protein [Methanobrevibacter sp. OttesenSCG-928-K11]|nr:methanogenesis marker 17 protein [Methanobrevibacter sp. OttesenSCG-928-K11]MDL2270834.1 methanogenesis marker 17 protein [Methanobrevibacter sp. OttesenSCG-928-I08]